MGHREEKPISGRDPYLEKHWGDDYTNLISYAQGMRNNRLPRDLRAAGR
jgi:hypothetical protein